jgi:hypothetical protein
MKKLIIIFLFIPIISLSQDDKKSSGLKKLIQQAEKLAKDLKLDKNEPIQTNFSSRDIGKTSFNIADRIAINDVIDAYGFYWDNNDLEGFLSLFSDDAKGLTNNSDGTTEQYFIKTQNEIIRSRKRMEYFIKNKMQRRHISANTFFIELTNNYAHLRQYMVLLTTNNKQKTEVLAPINYAFKLNKLNGIWKIVYREINLDKPLDLALSNNPD